MKATVNTKEKKMPLRRKWLLILLIIGLLSFFIYKENTTVAVTRYEIVSDKIPDIYDKYTFVQISDLHDAEFGENHLDVVNQVKMITPQAIFITGDFIDSNRYNLEQSLILIEELQFVAPIYYVTGNHEIATQDMERIQGALEELGVRVLSNEADVITMFPDRSIAIG
jgi:predicted MPP superfamily phosphohydrolase